MCHWPGERAIEQRKRNLTFIRCRNDSIRPHSISTHIILYLFYQNRAIRIQWKRVTT